MNTTVHFLNGDIIVYPIPPTDSEKIIDAICENYNNYNPPINPLQVILKNHNGYEDHDHFFALILPKIRIVVSDYVDYDKDEKDNKYLSDLYLHLATNESIIRHVLSILSKLSMEEMITNPLSLIYANPHPMVVDFLKTSGLLENFDKPITNSIRHQIMQNPSDIVVDYIMPYIKNIDFIIMNENPKVFDMMHNRFLKYKESRGMDDKRTQEIMIWMIKNPLSVDHMILPLIEGIPDRFESRILFELQNSKKIREKNPMVWTTLYERWLKNKNIKDDKDSFSVEDYVITKNLAHEKKYAELISKYEKSDMGRNEIFYHLHSISDSDEIVDWLVTNYETIMESKNVLNIYKTGSISSFPSNPHPRVVEWALEKEERWNTFGFVKNPNPHAVDKIVDIFFNEKTNLQMRKSCMHNPNHNVLWKILRELRELRKRRYISNCANYIDLSTLLIRFEKMENVEIVFE